ncbi:GrpB family protein [Anaerotignum sp. MB30-C6]|uniref:GrpB family protein n=1 Tax=Anaerotignum sp. MB30-C6 TaxID=3070814 RepID=UPI0027DB9C8D|nr:GrpB family protein [Anaerotignum sp. MB30-C6]WMI80027.1 GrpB family protein [Anaerotignum sp. MB30-C6]
MSKKLSDMSIEELWRLFPIILTNHKDEWIEWYNIEHSILCNILDQEEVSRISHMGSTAISGIRAKPTVDILVELQKNSDMKEVKNKLLLHGYICMSEEKNGISLNKGYTEQGFAERVFHLHLRFAGDNDELYFRDYMNDNPMLATEYEKLKLSLCEKYKHNRDGYTEAKTVFIKKYTQRAKMQYGNRYD